MYLDTSHAQNLKEKLLLCAVNEFAEYGYEGARVDNIVKAAGCSKQTVYHHFGNKENLFIEVLEYTWNDIREKERELDISGLSPVIAIEKIIDFTWDYYIVKTKVRVCIIKNQNASLKLTMHICSQWLRY